MEKAESQLWLFEPEQPKKAKPRRLTPQEYEEIAIWIGDRAVTTEEILNKTGSGVTLGHVIDYLSLNYTLYDVSYGVYRMLKPVRRKNK